MSNVVSASDPLVSSEITMVANLLALPAPGAGYAIVKTGTTTFANVSTGGGGGSGYQTPLTGGLTGTNTWTTAPSVIVVDGVPMQKIRTDGTVNWTIVGLTTTLTIAPSFDIFASA